ncbi:hypothetical protein GXW82_12155 [Streptacidiphilus sp. 4-A2]|nr:hypothetical protein [Streptacidiphilus sp. 4-A2]
MTAGADPHSTDVIRQVVLAEAGYAVGVIGADIHVVGDGRPLYRLANLSPGRPGQHLPRTVAGLPSQPSHLLDARSAVVDFTGRDSEVRHLTAWCHGGDARAVHWLHAPGGQGKTRLAGHIAARAAAGGWKVITADRGLVRQDPAAYENQLAVALKILVDTLIRLRHLEQAVTAAGEAVILRRKLVQDNPADHAMHLANMLKYLAEALGALGRHGEAAAAAREAAEIRLRLAGHDPMHRSSGAVALTLLASNVLRLDADEALTAGQHAAGILRPLAREDPAGYSRPLARALAGLEDALHQLGRGAEARAAARERRVVLRDLESIENPS